MVGNLLNFVKNIPGKSVRSKFLIFESDDWGSVRMPSMRSYESLKNNGVDLGIGESLRYNISDTLASKEDFVALYEVLSKYKDHLGNHPIFTAISVVANPDFEAIKNHEFQKYFFEPFIETLKRYGKEDSFALWREGIDRKLFYPEFHGREHLNVAVWMRALQNKDRDTLLAFEEGCWGIMNHLNQPYGIMYQAAFDLEYRNDLISQEEIIKSGLSLFKDIHGYEARYFVPPNGPFNNSLEKVLSENGIQFIGAAKLQLEPQGLGKVKRVFHWLGQKNTYGQSYITRNAFFEPNSPGIDWVNGCLANISDAFKWNKPAVISTHRTNYIGSLNLKNRSNSLELLDLLLSSIVKTWPDVEFITSTQLGKLIQK